MANNDTPLYNKEFLLRIRIRWGHWQGMINQVFQDQDKMPYFGFYELPVEVDSNGLPCNMEEFIDKALESYKLIRSQVEIVTALDYKPHLQDIPEIN